MIIKPMIRSNICINSHPAGCAQETRTQISYVISKKNKRNTKSAKEGAYAPKTVLVLGCSTGYGLASRISAAFEFGADTIGVSFEKEATEKKGGTPGFYNNLAFDKEAEKAGLRTKTFNGDAYSDECKENVIDEIKSWNSKVDLVIYSLASPVRTDPDTKIMYKSVIKPVGKVYGGPSLDMMTGKIGYMEAEPATDEEIANTVKVMGGEDWERWISKLMDSGVLAEGCRTVAYSYIGPELSHPIYRDGTIGEAKKHLEKTARDLDQKLKAINGGAFVSVNKGLITRSSSVIPIITQYLGVLFKEMKKSGTHEGCIEQMERMFAERLYTADKKVPVDSENRIRMDDLEMNDEMQKKISEIMTKVTEENVCELVDLEGIRHDFMAINGFDVDGIDYEKEVTDMRAID